MDQSSATRRKLDFSSIQRRRSLDRKYRRTDDLYGPGPQTNLMQCTSTPCDYVLGLNHRQATVRHGTFPKGVDPVEKTYLWAANGFFYNEKGNAECFCCHVEIQDWMDLQDPMRIHLERYPNCRFRRGEDTGNIPFNCRPVSPQFGSSSDDDLQSPECSRIPDSSLSGRVLLPSYYTPPTTPQRERSNAAGTRSMEYK